jgi:hypothetical protein
MTLLWRNKRIRAGTALHTDRALAAMKCPLAASSTMMITSAVRACHVPQRANLVAAGRGRACPRVVTGRSPPAFSKVQIFPVPPRPISQAGPRRDLGQAVTPAVPRLIPAPPPGCGGPPGAPARACRCHRSPGRRRQPMASGQVHTPPPAGATAARQPRPPGVVLAGAMPGDAGAARAAAPHRAAAPVPPAARGRPP